MPELKLCEVHRQIFLANVMVGADHATFQECPERLDIVGMDFAAHVFILAVIDRFMATPKMAVAGVLISNYKRYSVKSYQLGRNGGTRRM